MDTVKKRILVIDDTESVREYLRYILEREGYAVHTADNGTTGLAMFNQHGGFSLVITDIAMPGLDGIETLIELKQTDPRLKVIVISGADRSESLLRIANIFKADATVAKPFTQDAIAMAVYSVLGKSVPAGIPAGFSLQ